MAEADLYDKIRLAASSLGCRLFRNNVGVFRSADKGQRFIRVGLCTGSSDLVGWRMVSLGGTTVAQFVALEVKLPGAKTSKHQAVFLRAVADQGGLSGVVTSVRETLDLLKQPIHLNRDHD